MGATGIRHWSSVGYNRRGSELDSEIAGLKAVCILLPVSSIIKALTLTGSNTKCLRETDIPL